jgi:hypothetical protein
MQDTTNSSLDLIKIAYEGDDPSITITWNWIFLICAITLVLLPILFRIIYVKKIKGKYFINKVKIKVKLGNVEFEEEIQKNYQNLYIANRIYIELATRKAAIPFDEEHDVIKEVYDSWFVLFKTIRNEIKTLPGEFLKNHKSSEKLIELTTEILNSGLRPHLTVYQAKFRKWYEEQLEESSNIGRSPQEIQKEFGDYDNLIADLKEVNNLLQLYKIELKKLIS